MASCRIVNVLYAAVPFRFVRDLLIRTHMDRCEFCQGRLASRGEAGALFVKTGDAGEPGELWRKIEARAGRTAPARAKMPAWLRWDWAAGAATLLAVAVAGFWLLRGVQSVAVRADFVRPADRFEISYVSVGGAPAQTFVYQPHESDTVFVWVGKNP